MDMRLIDPTLPDDPNSKVNRAIEKRRGETFTKAELIANTLEGELLDGETKEECVDRYIEEGIFIEV